MIEFLKLMAHMASPQVKPKPRPKDDRIF